MTSSRECETSIYVDNETSMETFELIAWFADDEKRLTDPMPSLSDFTKQRLQMTDNDDLELSFMIAMTNLVDIKDEQLRQEVYWYMCGYSETDLKAMLSPDRTIHEIAAIVDQWSEPKSTKEPISHEHQVVPLPVKRARAPRKPRQPKELLPVEEESETSEDSSAIDTLGMYLRNLSKTALLNAEEEVELAKDIEAGLYAKHLLHTTEEASVERRRDLRTIQRIGEAAMNRMIQANLRLVVSQAKREWRSEMPLDDRIQNGNLGLIRAVEKFDYTLGYKFSTYASWWIKQAIKREAAGTERIIRMPVHVSEKLAGLKRTKSELVKKLGREPTIDEIAVAHDMPVKKVEDLFSREPRVMSYNIQIGSDGDTELSTLLKCDDDPLVEDEVFHGMVRGTINSVLATLDPQEREVIECRFGLRDGTIWTLDMLGSEYGLSRERIRQVEVRALAKLQGTAQQLNYDTKPHSIYTNTMPSKEDIEKLRSIHTEL